MAKYVRIYSAVGCLICSTMASGMTTSATVSRTGATWSPEDAPGESEYGNNTLYVGIMVGVALVLLASIVVALESMRRKNLIQRQIVRSESILRQSVYSVTTENSPGGSGGPVISAGDSFAISPPSYNDIISQSKDRQCLNCKTFVPTILTQCPHCQHEDVGLPPSYDDSVQQSPTLSDKT